MALFPTEMHKALEKPTEVQVSMLITSGNNSHRLIVWLYVFFHQLGVYHLATFHFYILSATDAGELKEAGLH